MGNKFIGILQNAPYYITTIKAGSTIEFFDRHIATVIYDKHKNVDLEKMALITKKALEKREINKVSRAEKEEIKEENDSGWELFYDDEHDDQEYCTNPENIVWIKLDDVLDMELLLENVFIQDEYCNYIFNKDTNAYHEVKEL